MWTSLAHNVIKYRFYFILAIALVTAFMAWHAKDVSLSYDFSKAVPSNDPDMIKFREFCNTFGEDGNIIVIGMQDSVLYTTKNFGALKKLADELSLVKGVNGVISLANMLQLKKNVEQKNFEVQPLFNGFSGDQETLDSMLNLAMANKIFSSQLVNEKNGATLIIVAVDQEVMNSRKRIRFTGEILEATNHFTEATGIQLHHAGLPYIRTMVSEKVKGEMQFFLVASVVVTALILLFLFRSWDAVVIPLIIISVVVIWSMGTLALFGYKITLLTGLIPPIIVIIGIPNSIYLLNKYHQEIDKHGNKMKALSRVMRKIGIVTLMTNLTTAIGFLVLGFTDIILLREFGLVAGINIMATFVVSNILIPAVFTYLPTPKGKQLKHLEFKSIDAALSSLDWLVHRHKYSVFGVAGLVVIVSVFGLLRMRSIAYMVDDLPESSIIKKDLAFFEKNFGGVIPLEIVIDTGRKNGILQRKALAKADELEKFLDSIPFISNPVSVVSFVKAARQAFYNNNPKYYDLPGNDWNFILQYLRDLKGQKDASGLLNNFIDSTGQTMRISMNMADIGSVKMDSLIAQKIQPAIERIFSDSGMTASLTGSTPLFVKGNKFLIQNLHTSLLMAFALISLVMAYLYRNFRIIVISLIPNIIPLLMIAGIMGYFNIPVKPSTALIFSIAFGISVDYSIHLLARYRQELRSNHYLVPVAVSNSLKGMGSSIMYTSLVLFSGFIIFAGSGFGGTVALGILTSTTLLISMFTNLTVLPSLLLAFDDGKRQGNCLSMYDEEYYLEDDDEEIDVSLIGLNNFTPDLEKDNQKTEVELGMFNKENRIA